MRETMAAIRTPFVLVLTGVLAALLVTATAPPASSVMKASEGCSQSAGAATDQNGFTFRGDESCPADPGDSSDSRDTDPGSNGPVKCYNQATGEEVACTDGNGAWWGGYCYLAEVPEDSRPPKTDPLWDGHTDGSIYGCGEADCVGAGAGDAAPSKCQTSYTNLIWLPGPPGLSEADVEALAQKVVDSMELRPPEVGITPRPDDPDSIGAVGLPNYLWVADAQDPRVFGPITESAETDNVRVEATARVVGVDWDMGNGDVVTCDGPGIPYDEEYGGEMVTDCGYVYQEQGDPYTVTATIRWEAEWNGAGLTGTIETTRSSSVNVRIGEIQVLSQ